MPDTAIARTPVPRLDQPGNVRSNLEFESWLYNWAMFIRGEQAFTLDLVEAAVTMHIRSRGVTLSDMCSSYGVRSDTQGQWLQYDPDLDGEVHPINIVGPAVTTNKNACLQSNAAVEVTSANQSAEHKQIAERWQRISDFFERTTWEESKRGIIFDAAQKEGTNLVDTFPKLVDSQSVPDIRESQGGLAVYRCEPCNKIGLTQTSNIPTEDQAGENVTQEGLPTEVECPDCGEMASAMVRPIKGMTMGEDKLPVYDIEDETISFFNYTVDTYGAKTKGLKGAGWLQIQRLKDLVWMQTQFPGRTFSGPSKWSYSVQCDYALSRGRSQFLNYQPSMTLAEGHERYEVREIYLHEDAYSSYRSPRDFEFTSSGGETFRIKQGQSIGEAQEEMYGENQHGFKFLWIEDTLLTIVSPKKEELNLRYRFSDVHWSRESGGYNSAPNYSLVYIQDDITLLNTLHHNIIARNAVNPIFYDSLVFEEGDFSKEFVGTKNAALLPDFDMRKSVTNLPIPTVSPYLSQQMQWLWEIKDSVSLVTPAMRGESQKGSPYAAQRQQLEQSYGNLTSVLKSFAQCKCTTFRNKGRLAKKFWTREQFERVGSMFGELWTEQDIVEMCDIDFDRDLVVSYREGSEMPSTPITKELKFFGALQQLGGVIAGLPPEIALQIVGEDKWASIIEQVGEMGDMDFDISGLEIDEVVSQKRFISLAKLCQPYEDASFDQIEMWRQQVVAEQPANPDAMQQSIQMAQSAPDDPNVQAQAQAMVQPTPITQLDLITEKIFHDSQIRFNKYEDFKQQQQFFVTQLKTEQGKTKPNEMLMAMLETLLGLLEQASQGQQQEAQQSDPNVQAQQQAQATADAAAQTDAAHKQGQLQLQAGKLQLESKKEASKTQLEHRKLDDQALREERKDLLGVAGKQADHAHQAKLAKEKPKPAAKKK